MNNIIKIQEFVYQTLRYHTRPITTSGQVWLLGGRTPKYIRMAIQLEKDGGCEETHMIFPSTLIKGITTLAKHKMKPIGICSTRTDNHQDYNHHQQGNRNRFLKQFPGFIYGDMSGSVLSLYKRIKNKIVKLNIERG